MAEATPEEVQWSRDWRMKAEKLSQAEGAAQGSEGLAESGNTALVSLREHGGEGAIPGPFRRAGRTKSD